MSTSSRIGLAALLITLIFAGVSGCVLSGFGSPATGGLPPDKYVALTETYFRNYTVLEGNGTIPYWAEPTAVPDPFDFDGSLGYADQYSSMPADYKIFDYLSYTESTPATSNTKVCCGGFPIPIAPLWLLSTVAVYDIDENGTLNATYDGQPLRIKAGETWHSPVKTEVLNETFEVEANGKVFHSGVFRQFTIRYDSSWTVENKGVFNKSNLKKK